MSARMARPWLLLATLMLMVSGLSCSQCGDEVVAEIARAKGDVQRDHRAFTGQFAKASVNDTLHLGDALRTGPGSGAELKLFPDGVARIEERTLVRFMSERPADGVERLTIEEGMIEIDAMAVDLELDTGHGIARVKKGSRIRLRANDPNDVQLDVLVGRVRIERKGQPDERIQAGETLTLAAPRPAAAAAQPALVNPPDAPAPAPAAPASGAGTAAAPEPTPPGPIPPGPTAAPEPAAASNTSKPAVGAATDGRDDADVVKSIDFRLSSLEDAVIHATVLPVDIALPIEPCVEAASVSIKAGSKRRTLQTQPNASEVLLRLKAGPQKIEIRCGTQTRNVSLRVLRDAATQELPRSAPEVDVAADGRRYTVRYQNVLPSVAFSWPGAEPSPRYVLLIKREQGREQRFESTQSERTLKSGELTEGEYSFAFQTADGKRSADSHLRISFDNTARSAYLSEPTENSVRGDAIRVAGGALSKSNVSVAGVPIQPDNQGRFEATLPHAASDNAIAVRVSHPSTGVHYYVRRLR